MDSTKTKFEPANFEAKLTAMREERRMEQIQLDRLKIRLIEKMQRTTGSAPANSAA
jgi:hypothetical protein